MSGAQREVRRRKRHKLDEVQRVRELRRQGLTLKQIAQLTGVPISTARVWCSEEAAEANRIRTRQIIAEDPLRPAWNNARIRCQPGGRYEMHPEWLESYQQFRDDIIAEIGPRPSPEHRLTRIDRREGWVPGNLCWWVP